MSVIGRNSLPAGLGHSRDVALVGELSQAQPAEAELAEVRAGAPAAPASIVGAGLVLGLALLSNSLRSLGHGLLGSLALGFRSATGLRRLGARLFALFALLAFLRPLALRVGLGVLLLEL